MSDQANVPAGTNRRQFLARAGIAGAAAAAFGTGVLNAPSAAKAALPLRYGPAGGSFRVSDLDILNFALNLEYLEAQFYSYAANGHGLDPSLTTGLLYGKANETPSAGGAVVGGGGPVPFTSSVVQQYAQEIAADELAHVQFLRSALGQYAVSQPSLDIGPAFSAAAVAAGVIQPGQTFDPYANETNFLLGAFVFEDVGVTAYHGAAPYLSNSTYLSAAAGILGTEAYHAAAVRSVLIGMAATNPSVATIADAISALRAKASGADDDQGITFASGATNIGPTDSNSITFARTFQQVLSVVTLGGSGNKGGFFPGGLTGRIA